MYVEEFQFYVPTKIVYGTDVVKEAGGKLALGKKALIVTGGSSARLSGALDDVLGALGSEFVLFDQVENNPGLQTVARGAELARQEGCDYVIAIGGGSPLDAGKIMGVLAANELEPSQLYQEGWKKPALPLVAIPTTAGTGSEVTQYAVLTLKEEQTKKGLAGADLFPAIAYLDPGYTRSLPESVTIDTAVDALSHLVEGYLAKKASAVSDLPALQGIALWGTAIEALRRGRFDAALRRTLLLASTLGGVTIAHTGTTLAHALGYSLTYFHACPHGRANGLLMSEYLRFTAEVAPDRVSTILELLDLDSLAQFQELMTELFAPYQGDLRLNSEQVSDYAARALLTRNIANSWGDPGAPELVEILRNSLGE